MINEINEEGPFAVAIDGPGGAGKSTVAKAAAAALGMTYIDTGAMYRAVALYCLQKMIGLNDQAAVEGSLELADIRFMRTSEGQRLYLNNEDVTEALRMPEVSEGASLVAQYEGVRKKLSAMQREIALMGRVVMDGRDICAYVLPWAQVKIYLDADLETRASRRIKELREKGQTCDMETVRRELAARDERDASRAFAPLAITKDALYIDAGHLTPEEVTTRIVEAAKEHIL
jgi:cytidylate kinase